MSKTQWIAQVYNGILWQEIETNIVAPDINAAKCKIKDSENDLFQKYEIVRLVPVIY